MLNTRLTLGLVTLSVALLATACTPSQTETTSENQPETTETVQSAIPEESTAPEATSPPTATESDPAETVEAPTAETTEPTATSAASRSGNFVSGEHATQGSAVLVSQDGAQMLTFDNAFSTSSGPDLVVVLHRSAAVLEETTPPAYPLLEEDYVVLAPLTAITGTQQYAIPAEVNVDEYQSVAIWCQAFNATFGAAALN